MITLSDVDKRLCVSSGVYDYEYKHKVKRMLENAFENKRPSDIVYCIEHWKQLPGEDVELLENVLNLYDLLIEEGSSGSIRKMGRYIAEDAVPKVRDSKATASLIKRRLGRLKTKLHTKIKNNVADVKSAAQASLEKMKSNLGDNTTKIANNVKNALPIGNKSDDTEKKEEAALEGYLAIYDAAERNIQCDRILENYNILSKRFNIDKLFTENTRINGPEDTVFELCSLVDTYKMNNKIKINTVLETSMYAFHKNSKIEVPINVITDCTVDYFLSKPNGLEDCKAILDAAVLFNTDDATKDIQLLTEEDPEEVAARYSAQDYIQKYCSGNMEFTESTLAPIPRRLTEEATYDFDKIFQDWKKYNMKNEPESKLKQLVNKLYGKNVSNIIDGTPNFLNWLRYVFVLGGLAINPVVGAVIAIGDLFISMHKSRKELEQMIKCFEEEKAKSEKKLDTLKDEEKIENMEEYIEALDKVIDKLNDELESKMTDAEVDRKYNDDSDAIDSIENILDDDKSQKALDEKKKKKNDDDFDFDDDDFDDEDFNLEEAVKCIPKLTKLVESWMEYTSNTGEYNIDPNIINTMSSEDIDNMSSVVGKLPELLDKEDYCATIRTESRNIRRNEVKFESSTGRYTRLHCYDDALMNLSQSAPYKVTDIFEAYRVFSALDDIKEAVALYDYSNTHSGAIMEFSIENTLKLASEKVKKAFTKLSDKDKQVSKNIDMSANNFKKAVEKSLTTDNRESIIRGSILPSASKMLKMVLTSGAVAILIDPVLAVIGVLGYIGTSKAYKAKERQLVLDEIEIELKMVEKYIDIAESKNDMKSLKSLLRTQRELERQRQRIKYKMNVKWGQNPHVGDDSGVSSPRSSVED